MLKLLARTTASAALIALPLAACGGGSSSSSCGSEPTGTAAVTVHALDALKFDQKDYTAKAGDVTIDYVNDGSQAHTLVVENKGYKIFCDVPGHRSAGMEATLTVQ
jgi:plastocyanin